MFKIILVAALIVCAVAESEDHHADTKVWKTDLRHDGWDSEFETTNHIRQAAHGDEHGNIHGDFEWVDPKGEHVAISYKADEHGYHPEGEVLPTPHPIPEHILKALEYIKAHPAHEEEHDHHHH